MNWFKTFLWMIVLSVILVIAGSALGYATGLGAGLGLALGLAIALITNGIAYFKGDQLALHAAQAREVTPFDAPDLHRLADRLAQQYGVPKPRVYLSPDPTPNAFATGRNPHHASICVNQGLLRILDGEELYGVLAHEFAHVRNRDILISSVVAVMAAAITFIASLLQWQAFGLGGRDRQDRGAFGLIGVLALAILGPIAALLIQLAISRAREYEADHTGAEVSGQPLARASALRKLERSSEMYASPVAKPAYAHLYIVNPLSGRSLSGMFSTHPPLEDRIQRLERMAGASR
ncbi:MAG: zinc metalloprotease HtpX [Candidatus Dormibacter sp.]|uniref:zinc metalloprotease HtpX n=1 Tax=Candidatus Dormibacter sp. TaxID=2973982 RepID=UPI000DB81DB7|nr:MAG: protease HtpX [Candidatus Dormibacteraeota bacterium]